MAVLPSPTLVAGQNYAIFEAWYRHVDPKNLGSIGALDAANFLKKSGLHTSVLGKIWDLSDPQGRGYLDQNGFFTALKLVALAQNGIEVSMSNISRETTPPEMGEQPPSVIQNMVATPIQGSFSLASPTGNQPKSFNWVVTATDRAKYDALFDSLNPVSGKLPGFKVKEVLVNSTLPMESLGKIWDLSDMDHDGALDRHEFTVAMHLVYKVLDNYPLPVSLPPELLPPSPESTARRGSTLSGGVSVLPPAVSSPENLKEVASNGPSVAWVVSDADKTKYGALFLQADMDRDGYVSGLEIKDVFLQSHLPQPVLAHIWGLCDVGQTGKLNNEQFALAMWLVQQKVQGRELPTVLTPEMMPPSLRTQDTSVEESTHSAELEQIAKEIENLIREKRQLETDVAQKEADIRIKNGEVRNLQSELDTLAATLKQLEVQKKEAQKRLDDLDAQQSALEQDLLGVERQIEEHEKQVRTFRTQAEEQENTLRTQEAEVAAKKQELNNLRSEELQMEQRMQAATLQLDKLQTTLQDSHLQISQIQSRMMVLQEHQRQVDEALAAYDEALETGDPSQLGDNVLLPISSVASDSDILLSPNSDRNKVNGGTSHFNDGAFGSDPFSSLNGQSRGFSDSSNGDPFKESDFFKKTSQTSADDPFGAKDPFASAFGAPAKPTNDPFASAFGQTKSEPFDAFGRSKSPNVGADPFGSDPFNAPNSPLPAGRVESPTPALPPKKSKQPPPRPAPPKAVASGVKGPQRPAPPIGATKSPDPFAPMNDPFSSASAPKDPFGGSGFADFASFESKFTSSSSGDGFDAWGSTSTSSTKPTAESQQHRYAELEFTEDPFKDVGFGDPFASNTDDPFAVPTITNSAIKIKKDSDSFDPFSTEKDPFASSASPCKTTIEFDSPFGSSAWNDHPDPFAAATAADNNNKSPSNWGNDFKFSSPIPSGPAKSPMSIGSSSLKSRSSSSSSPMKSKVSPSEQLPKLNEDAQIAWVAAESVRSEQERRRKAEMQEIADLEMAIALSKSEMNNRSPPSSDRLI
ncbi:epidermal growth factor receptor substrate 15-like 1 isoform X1 [Daphnia magna]|uniref:epidermal growth factor receptor substrate 15-like 1 isoform X1 n=2 Tax=Daphnia magna TaxID=35525 RepID=UPI00140359F6|nr:epidermal growth factor receptor substrate 15-like 1 isoform X1 [Daphnia magna]